MLSHLLTTSSRHPLVPSRISVESLEDRCTPAAMITITGATIVEGNDGSQNAVVRVNLTEPHGNAVTVNYRTADSSAIAGSDYSAVSGTLRFARGQTEKSVLIPVRGDKLAEFDEDFLVQLSKAKGAKIATGQAWVTIQDDEPRVSVSGGTIGEGDSGQKFIDFTVRLDRAYADSVTFDYATADGSAVAGEDYVGDLGSLAFAPGETEKTVSIAILGDLVPEWDESFRMDIDLTSANAHLAISTATGTIIDDEVHISVSGGVAYEGNDGQTLVDFVVTLSRASSETIKVDFATADYTAFANEDYLAALGTQTFAPGDLEKIITVAVLGDTEIEPDEYLTMNLTLTEGNALLLSPTYYGAIYDDDGYYYYDYGWYDYGYYDYGYYWF